MPPRVPVVALTGHLGAGKTSLLNHLLRTPGARLGVVVNDFGTLDVDVGELVAIGPHLDPGAAQRALRAVADAPAERLDSAGLRRLWRHRRLSD